jgi:hypothetical protein
MKNHHQVPVFKKLVDKKVNGKKRKNQLDLDEVLILSVPVRHISSLLQKNKLNKNARAKRRPQNRMICTNI